MHYGWWILIAYAIVVWILLIYIQLKKKKDFYGEYYIEKFLGLETWIISRHKHGVYIDTASIAAIFCGFYGIVILLSYMGLGLYKVLSWLLKYFVWYPIVIGPSILIKKIIESWKNDIIEITISS